jgi:hypothetical protein
LEPPPGERPLDQPFITRPLVGDAGPAPAGAPRRSSSAEAPLVELKNVSVSYSAPIG